MEAGFPGVKAVAAPTARSVIKVLRGAMVFNCSTKWAKEVLIELERREERDGWRERKKGEGAVVVLSHRSPGSLRVEQRGYAFDSID